MLQVIQIPVLFDNYTYLVVVPNSRHAFIVDCPEAEPVINTLSKHELKPVAIVSTHHHADHVAANEELKKYFQIPVYGSEYDRNRIPGLTHTLSSPQTFKVETLSFEILEIPGHTLGHIALYGHGALFCGDTLFSAGCGRLFEGTPAQMFTSLSRLCSLPDDTKVYCGHEYTKKNLEFVLSLEPDNQAAKQKYAFACEAKKENRSTVPTTLKEEKSYNPFLRADSLEKFTAIRKLKDSF